MLKYLAVCSLPKESAPAAAYDPYRDCLYSTGGSKLRRSSVESGKKVWVVDLSDEARDSLGARSGTRTTTVLLILMMNAGTKTGESNPRTSRDTLTPRAHSFSSSSLLLPPASHMVTKTESTH